MKNLSAPVLGAIVRVWLPLAEAMEHPGPRFQPCLVLATDESGGRRHVLVAASAGDGHEHQGCGFVVPAGRATRLEKDTEFCLQQRLWLPFEARFFRCRGLQPVPGRLSAALRKELRVLAKKMEARDAGPR